MYKCRRNTVVIVDLDSVVLDMDVIVKRALMYEQNNPDKNMLDYILAHINEQVPISSGIKAVWDLQAQLYKIVFVTKKMRS